MIPIKGNRITIAGSNQMVAMPATVKTQAPIQVRRFARNGKHPDADLEVAKNEHLNQIAMYRTKQIYCGVVSSGRTNSNTVLWRFAFHSGPLAFSMFVRMMLAPGFSQQLTMTVDLYSDATETTLVSSTTFNQNDPTGGTGSFGWQALKPIDQYIAIAADTDYYVKVSKAGCVAMGCVFIELASMTQNFSGYLPQNVHAQGNILDVFRQNQATLIKNLWKRNCAPVFIWTVEPGALNTLNSGPSPFTYKVTTSTTGTNVLDLTSTTVTVNTPGWTPDLTGKARLSQTGGVPCIMKVFGLVDAGTGTVELKDSGGSVVASVAVTSVAGQWTSSTAFNLPASVAKYDLHYRVTAGNTFSIWACSVYEYEA